MKIFLTLVVGILIGAAGFWFYNTSQGRAGVKAAGNQVKAARDAMEEKLKAMNLGTNSIKEELARGGQVVRRRAEEAGQAIADATADARTTAAIKARLLGSRDLSALSISVNTTGGVVTLSGSVNSTEEIAKAMLLAMEVNGVTEVISTLQLKPAASRR